MFAALQNAPRLLMNVELAPVQGDRFQPTGFADLGAAVYERPDGTRMLLVESTQSVANRLEKTCLAGDGPCLAAELKGLPYVLVNLSGASSAQTSSLVEAHRLNSPFIISDEGVKKRFLERTGYRKGQPLNWNKIAEAVFALDPSSLIHGVFMANLEDGRIKIPRALSGFIEAEDVREVVSGGVKNNPFDPTGTIRVETFDKDVYGNVPFHRTEYVARRITAYFSLDLALLRGFGLQAEALELLTSLSLLKIRRFLASGMRLRTACDLAPKGELQVTSPEGFNVPGEAELLAEVKKAIAACAEKELFQDPPVSEVAAKVKSIDKKTDKQTGKKSSRQKAETEAEVVEADVAEDEGEE